MQVSPLSSSTATRSVEDSFAEEQLQQKYGDDHGEFSKCTRMATVISRRHRSYRRFDFSGKLLTSLRGLTGSIG